MYKRQFQYGPLDQGWWPDGLYAAPTDEALRYDVEVTRQLGCNMARKHVKVEPARGYYWCDKLGLLVWQDMPSANNKTDEGKKQFELEWSRIVAAFANHPSIVMWVPFNEGWGQYDTPRIVEVTRKLDPSRLVNNASGWTDNKVGDVHDIHSYPGPAAPPVEEVKVGCKILEVLGLRRRELEIISCPSCGRAQVDVYKLAEEVTEGLKHFTVPIRVAVMGCVVNGPGEAREADLGVASGNGKGQIFVKGEVIATVPEDQIVATLIAEANKLADQFARSGAPEVSVN